MKMNGTSNFSRRNMLKVTGVAAALGVLPLAARIVNAADSQKMRIGIIGSGHVATSRLYQIRSAAFVTAIRAASTLNSALVPTKTAAKPLL
jgi:hypothetical protein